MNKGASAFFHPVGISGSSGPGSNLVGALRCVLVPFFTQLCTGTGETNAAV